MSLRFWAVPAVLLVSCTGGRTASFDSRPAPTTAPDASLSTKPDAEPTYWNRVAAIMEGHCASCHAEGGIGPMALDTFEQVKTHAAAIVYQTKGRTMPPWLPDTSSCAELRHSRALDQKDIRALERWAELGAPEGDKRDHRPVVRTQTYGTLAPIADRVVAPADGYTPKRGRPDDYHCFVIDPKLDRPERIVGLRIAPGLPSVVHHVLLFEVRAGAVERLRAIDEKEPGPGYSCFGGIGIQPTIRSGNLAKGELVDFDAQMIVGWAPGAGATDIAGAPTALPDGTAIKLAAGSRLVMQVHYSLENYRAKTMDKTRIEMWLAKDDTPLRQAVWIPLLDWRFRVPADTGSDDPRATSQTEVALPLPLEVRGVAPHMHLRGKSIHVASPNGCLIDVPRWDFHHQEGYWLTKGQRVDKASLRCTWDNRASAQPVVNGKRKPSHELHWGEGTDDEMCLAFLYATL